MILDKRMNIDMSAVFDSDDNFVTANFGAAAGFPANVLRYFPHYHDHGPKKKLQKSFGRAASNKNLK